MKQFFKKVSNFFKSAKETALNFISRKTARANLALASVSGEGYVDTGVKIIIAVVVGGVLLAGLYALFNTTIIQNLTAIENRITILLAGKACEKIFYPEETFLGASEDINNAMRFARRLVQEEGAYGYEYCYFSEHYYPMDPISNEKLAQIEKRVSEIITE